MTTERRAEVRPGPRPARLLMRALAAGGAALLIVLAFAGPAAAARGFSGGGRSFSGGARSSFSSRSSGIGRAVTPSRAAPSAGYSGQGRAVFSTPRDARGGAFSTTPAPFSRPREAPSSAAQPFSTGRAAYAGTGNTRERVLGGGAGGAGSGRSLSPVRPPSRDYDPGGSTLYPWRPPVVIYGGGFPPIFYHDWYWGMPWWQRMWFSPTFYGGPGYHYFLPSPLTVFLALVVIGAVVYLVVRALRARAAWGRP